MTLPLLLDEVPSKDPLRDYQQEGIDRLVEYRGTTTEKLPHGGQRALVVLPTGCGKTRMFCELPLLASKKILAIAHREELIDQAAWRFQQNCPGVTVGIERAEQHSSPTDKIIVASIQTIGLQPKRLDRFKPEEFSIIIVDEVHHALAPTYLKVFCHFGVAPDLSDLFEWNLEELLSTPGAARESEAKRRRGELRRRFENFRPEKGTPFLVGFTATPSRTDGVGLEYVLDDTVFSRTIREMIEAGWLCDIRGVKIHTGVDLDEVKMKGKDFSEKDLSQKVNNEQRNLLAVDAWQQHAEGRQTIVFAVDVQHTVDLADAFRKRNIDAATVVGTTGPEERHRTIRRFRDGQLKVLVNCQVLTEGFDAPETSCILLARPTKSSLLYTQMVGRGTRIAAGKKDLLVIDIHDSYKKAGVQNLNTMFGLPPRLDLGGGSVMDSRKAFDELEDKAPMSALLDATSLGEVRTIAERIDPLMGIELEPEIAQASKFSWIRTGFGYALSIGKSRREEGAPNDAVDIGIIVDTLGKATVKMKVHKERPAFLGRYDTPIAAITFVEEWLRLHRPEQEVLVSRTAKWREEAATEKQLQFLKKLLGKTPPEGLTRGQASAAIEKAKNKKEGAK